MKNNDELKNLVALIVNVAKSLNHIAERLAAFMTQDEIAMQRIDDKKFREINGVTRQSTRRWRLEGRMKYEVRNGKITYLLKDVYAFYEKRFGKKKEKMIVANRL